MARSFQTVSVIVFNTSTVSTRRINLWVAKSSINIIILQESAVEYVHLFKEFVQVMFYQALSECVVTELNFQFTCYSNIEVLLVSPIVGHVRDCAILPF
mgnify:CR=1 FL=1